MTAADPLITLSPEVLDGTPVFAGTRVPVKALFEYFESGERLDDFLGDFPSVSPRQALGVLELARRAVAERATAA